MEEKLRLINLELKIFSNFYKAKIMKIVQL